MCRPDLFAISADSPSNQAPQSPDAHGSGPVLTQSASSQAPDSSQSTEMTDDSRLTQSESSEPSGSPTSLQEPAVSWVEMEAVVAFHSTGTSLRGGIRQAVAYTSFLFQQRPDRVAVFGLYISYRSFSLVLMDAIDVYHTTLSWGDESARTLLLRVLYYINNPPELMMDPTVIRKKNTFTIKVADDVYDDYTLISCGDPVGRRTMVFQGSRPDAPVIKEQYLRRPINATEAEIPEKNILDVVHARGEKEMPGVVRVRWSGYVERNDGRRIECGKDDRKRQKVRIVLQDAGALFMTISTPYDALVTAWDALEGK